MRAAARVRPLWATRDDATESCLAEETRCVVSFERAGAEQVRHDHLTAGTEDPTMTEAVTQLEIDQRVFDPVPAHGERGGGWPGHGAVSAPPLRGGPDHLLHRHTDQGTVRDLLLPRRQLGTDAGLPCAAPRAGAVLSRHPARLPQQLDAALPGSGGEAGVGAHRRLLQDKPGLIIRVTPRRVARRRERSASWLPVVTRRRN